MMKSLWIGRYVFQVGMQAPDDGYSEKPWLGFAYGSWLPRFQVSRKPQGGVEDKPPTKHDVRGAAAITDQADNVVTVWENKAKRRRMEENPHDAIEAEKPDALITVEKQRNGGGWEGRMAMYFHAPGLRFHDDRHSPITPYDISGGVQ